LKEISMTTRKKKGVGLLISGAVFVVAGGVFIGMPTTPDWLGPAMSLVGLVANFLGFVVVFPDEKD
jgi:hypothetical protein